MSSHLRKPQPETADRRVRSVWPLIALAALAVCLASRSWRRWPDILVDFGNELYVPWRLTEGDVLYRDLFWVVGPASQYFNALLFQVFGVSLTTLLFANLAILAVIVVLIYVLFTCAADRLATTCLCAVFLVVFGFAQYSGTGNYNYVCPYRHEVTHGVCLCLLQIYCLVRHAESRRRSLLFLVGLCTGLLAMMKLEMFVASVGVCMTAGLLTLVRQGMSGQRLLRVVVFYSAGVIPPIAIGVVMLCTQLPLNEAVDGLSRPWNLATRPELTFEYPLFAQLMGFDAPLDGVARISFAVLGLLFVTSVAVAIDASSRRWARRRRLICILLAGSLFAASYRFVPVQTWLQMGMLLPVVVAFAGGISCFRAVGAASEFEFRQYFFLSLWSALSALLLLKMLLNVQFGHYGFVLAMPATLLALFAGTTQIPAVLKRWRGTGDVFRAMVLGLVAAWACALWQRSDTIYQRKIEPFGARGDVTYHDPTANYRSALMPAVLADLQSVLPADATLMVLPYGIQLNYLLRKRNPTPFFLMTPWEMSACGGEGIVLESMQSTPPDFIVIIDDEIQGHGFTRFGQPGYGARLLEWIDGQYEVERGHIGTDQPSRSRFRAVIYRRRVAAN